MHQLDAGKPQHIGDLVRIDEHRGGAVGDHGAGEFRDRHQAAFHMHVPVAEAGHQIAAPRIDHRRGGTDGMRGIGSHIGKAAGDDGHVGVRNDFARMHVHPGAIADHRFRRPAAHGHVDQQWCGFEPGLQHKRVSPVPVAS